MNGAARTLTDVIERNRRDTRRRALRALLACPMMPRSHPAYALVRQHAGELREWFAREAGWTLTVEDGFARLVKQVADHRDDTRGARPARPAGAPAFSRRRYSLLCLALAELEKGEAQITLGRLGEVAVNAAADPAIAGAGLRFRLDGRDDRRDLVAVVRLLLGLSVLQRVAGDEASFVQSRERDVLYDVRRNALAGLLCVSRGPSLVERELAPNADIDARIAAVTQRFVADSPDARNADIRRRLTARLLDDPVLYWSEIDEAETAYLASQRPHLVRRIREATGLEDEHRAEGMALVDPVGDLTDLHLPSEGTDGHATLLVADWLSRQREPVPLSALEGKMRDWAARFKKHWRKSASEPGAETELVRAAVEQLCALRLARIENDGVLPLPAIGRHALGETTVIASQKVLL